MAASDLSDKVYASIVRVLACYTSKNIAEMLLNSTLLRKNISRESLEKDGMTNDFARALETGVDLFCKNEVNKKECMAALAHLSMHKDDGHENEPVSPKVLSPAPPSVGLPTKSVYDSMVDILTEYCPKAIAVGFLNPILLHLNINKEMLEQRKLPPTLGEMLESRLLMLIADSAKKEQCRTRIYQLLKLQADARPDEMAPLSIPIVNEGDIVVARNQARNMAESIGLDKGQQIKVATAVSELSRNIVRYVGKGMIMISVVDSPSPGSKALPHSLSGSRTKGIEIIARDEGHGIDNLEQILSGQYKSKTGLGLGIWSCKKLMDYFDIKSGTGGTQVTIRKYNSHGD